MGAPILTTRAVIDHVQLADDAGVLVLIPTATLRRWLLDGRTEITLHFRFDDVDLAELTPAPPEPMEPPAEPVTITKSEAARRLKRRLDDVMVGTEHDFEALRSQIRAAVENGSLVAVGEPGRQRIPVEPFDAYASACIAEYLDGLD